MPTVYRDNIVLGRDNRRLFLIGSNLISRFKIGDEKLGYWLTGQFVGEDLTPLFSGKLYLPSGVAGGTIIDNFPKAADPGGWTRAPAVGQEGYDLKNDAGEILFGYRIAGNVCRVVTNVYDDKGELAASASDGGLIVRKGPAQIG